MKNKHTILMLGLLTFLSMTVPAQSSRKGPEKECIQFKATTTICSEDGGQSWYLTEGTLETVPDWAKSWVNLETPPKQWIPKNGEIKLQNGTSLQHDASLGVWEQKSGTREALPDWAKSWFGEAPIRSGYHPGYEIKSRCQEAQPVQQSKNVRFGEHLAIQSFDEGKTWSMAEGKQEDLPAWAAAWLNQPAQAAHPTKELAFGEARIESRDGGKTWTQIAGHSTDLPDWVRPWIEGYSNDAARSEVQSAQASELEVFPNPTRGMVTLRYHLNQPQQVRIALYDLQGRLVQLVQEGAQPEGKQELRIQTTKMATGTYFLEFNSEERQSRVQVVKTQ